MLHVTRHTSHATRHLQHGRCKRHLLNVKQFSIIQSPHATHPSAHNALHSYAPVLVLQVFGGDIQLQPLHLKHIVTYCVGMENTWSLQF